MAVLKSVLRRVGVTASVLLCAAAPAHATVVTGTFIGIITSGNDNAGVYGTPGASLVGDTITGVITLDTSGLPANTCGSNPDTSCYADLPGTFMTIANTVNGITHTFVD